MTQLKPSAIVRGAARGVTAVGDFLSAERKPGYVYLTAFFLPFLIVGLFWAAHGVRPFGNMMILSHDQWHQYYPFYLDLRTRLKQGDSLFHSWTIGMGTSYLPLFAYYLASPMNLIAVLLPESLVMPYYTLTVLVKISLAGLFCAVFLKKTFQRSTLMVAAFSTMYALCAYIMGYYWNAIWLDTVALLPLVTLGTFSLLRDRRCVLYIFSLALSVFCNYYIGLFTCIFVLLVFIGWNLVNWDDVGGLGARLLRIAICSLIAIGMTAVLTLPTYLGLQATSSAANNFPKGFELNITQEDTWAGAFDAFKTVLSRTGTLTVPTSFGGELPNVFCGFSTLILALLYCFCRRIPLRERLYCVFLLLFFAASMIFRKLDYLWHGLHFPNMLPYRFSFLWSFVVVFMAYRLYTQIQRIRWWHLALMAAPLLGVLLCVAAKQSAEVVVATFAVTAVVVTMLALYSKRIVGKGVLSLTLAVCMLGEAILGSYLGIRDVSFTDGTYYPTKKEGTAAMVKLMQEREADSQDLWRAEVATKQTLNDSAMFGYPGVSVFSSAANSRVSAFLASLGMAAGVAANRYSYQQADPFTNLLLGVKYLIDRDGLSVDSDFFTQVGDEDGVLLLENRYYLPLGFMVNDSAAEYDISYSSGQPYDRLNSLFRQMTGEDEALFVKIPWNGSSAGSDSLTTVGGAKITASGASSFSMTSPVPSDLNNCAIARIRMPRSGFLCIYSRSSNSANLLVSVNGAKKYYYSDKYGYNRYMGRFNEGDEICLYYRPTTANQVCTVSFQAAFFQQEVFLRGYEKLSQARMMTTLVTDTEIEGAVQVEKSGLLYLSVPDDEGWKLTVDEHSAKITPVGNAMIATHLEPGIHSVRLHYEAPGFSLGLKISIVCLALFLVLVILAILSRFTRPPIVEQPLTLEDPDAALPAAEQESAEASYRASGSPEQDARQMTEHRRTTMPPLEPGFREDGEALNASFDQNTAFFPPIGAPEAGEPWEEAPAQTENAPESGGAPASGEAAAGEEELPVSGSTPTADDLPRPEEPVIPVSDLSEFPAAERPEQPSDADRLAETTVLPVLFEQAEEPAPTEPEVYTHEELDRLLRGEAPGETKENP